MAPIFKNAGMALPCTTPFEMRTGRLPGGVVAGLGQGLQQVPRKAAQTTVAFAKLEPNYGGRGVLLKARRYSFFAPAHRAG